MESKACRCCFKTWPLWNFDFQPSNVDGYRTTCKTCLRMIAQDKYDKKRVRPRKYPRKPRIVKDAATGLWTAKA